MLPTFGTQYTKAEKKNMLGSPKRKKQRKCSPRYNDKIRKIKISRSREHGKHEKSK